MRWVTAAQLETWARSVGARADLPKIVSDLIRASAPEIASIRFPNGDKGQVRGFDGHLVSDVAALNVPLGRSYWEFGANADYKAKAKEDFEKRSKEIPDSDRNETTFVFVSPWTWDSSDPTNKLEDFVAACKASFGWKDVRYIDGSALETWLEHRPAVSAWHARNTLRVYPVDGIRCTDEFWDEFAGQFGPPITEEVLLAEREKAAEQLIRDLLVPSNSVQLIADSPDEVLAFSVAAIRKAPAELRLFLEARTVMVDSTAAGRQLLPGTGLILLLRNDAAKSPRQFASVGTTLVPLGRQPRGAGTTTLVKPTAYAMGVAMRSMGIEENRALTLARGCGRSLAALARLIPGGLYDPPAWLQKGRELLPAILAGGWDSSNACDCEIVQQIAGAASCAQIEGHARGFLRDGDRPLDLEGTIWKVSAPMDAFVRVGPLIGAEQAALLQRAMQIVFAEIEPEPDPDEAVNVSRPGVTKHSEWLRDGLATTLLLFAVWGDAAEVNLGGESGQTFANRVLTDLPGLRTDPRLLTSLRNELPLLAEAAPDPLLSALECLLEGAGEAILPIFKEQSGWLHQASGHTGVLWALEVLAWDPEYFRRSVMILARLAAIDPGGQLSNRPQNSLAEIFLLWNPNTNASSVERLAVLDDIVNVCPGVGWRLVLTLLPTVHGASTPTAKPRLREAGAADRPAITYRELWANQAAVAERAIALAGHDLVRWTELVGRIAAFAAPERTTAIAALDDTLARFGEVARKDLWTTLRSEVTRHERFRSATWALPEQELEPLRSLAEKYAPTDPVSRAVALFDTGALDDALDHSGVRGRRAALIRQLHTDSGSEAVVRLADEAEIPYLLVEAIDHANFSEEEILDLLTLSFTHGQNSSFTMGLSGLYRKVAGPKSAETWLRGIIDGKMTTSAIVGELLLTWPEGMETWRLARRLGRDVVDAYWTQRSPHYIGGSRTELFWSLLMLLRYGRAVQAIQSSLNRMKELPSKLILRMLDGVVPQLNAQAALPGGMTSFYVEQSLAVLDQRADVAEHDIALREFRFFPLLEHSNRHLRLYDAMAKDPELFHQLLRNVYRGKSEEKGDVDPQTEANARLSYSILSHFAAVPGAMAGAEIDSTKLGEWVDKVREIGAQTDRADITDMYVGRVLAHAPADPDGVWPHQIVRAMIERLASDEIEQAIQVERFNMRGVFSKGIYDGGEQERGFAQAAYAAAVSAASTPRTAALLRAIGRMWDEDGRRADLQAAQQRLRS